MKERGRKEEKKEGRREGRKEGRQKLGKQVIRDRESDPQRYRQTEEINQGKRLFSVKVTKQFN